MKNIQLFFILILIQFSNAQDISFDLKNLYVTPFGMSSDLVGFNPLFKLDSDSIHNKVQSEKIRKLPKNLDVSQTSYCFFYFTGVSFSSFKNELVALIENYTTDNPSIFIDRNGNLDFTDDGTPIIFKNNSTLELANNNSISAIYHYQLSKSQISPQYESKLKQNFAEKFPKSNILPAKYWLAYKRLSVRVSKHFLDKKPITILLIDNSVDGMFSFQTNKLGDRVLVLEGHIDTDKTLTSILRFAEPISHNAIFKIYNKKYHIKNVTSNGNKITLSQTHKKPSYDFKKIKDLTSLSITLLDDTLVTLKDLIKTKKYLLIDVGGTWCRGCVSQEPIVKNMYKNGDIEVLGIFKHDTFKSVEEYIKNHELKWPVALADENFDDIFRINMLPTYILISNEGKVVLIAIEAEEIEKYINEMN
ncbi:TlpA disulfide reductase family protein [uncultured Psychroserpens sp.]|uniref:TlpA family protein disulfide reductase n=1 Tax=uncultured Psychroserpens sp. TaxID=255436 RepID=UPI0026171E2B|nr:TlpA disulfide reductase family protein [uncultured Psychroserpens sp.]